MTEWGFYGRKQELAQIQAILDRGRFFFCAISGRRRIGKTSLIQEALRRTGSARKAIYVQIPDSDERGVVQAFEDSFSDTPGVEVLSPHTNNFQNISTCLLTLWDSGITTAIDEFQYLNRKPLRPFLSELQKDIDRARLRCGDAGYLDDDTRDLWKQVDDTGHVPTSGLFTLGSIHTELTAVLEDKASPLFNRVTDTLHIGHWDSATLFEMFREHGIADRHHQLFLWSIFEGIPKFYRDCFDQTILKPDAEYRRVTLRKMFFEGSSPLKDEADNWFLRELRGRYDSLLTILARLGPSSHGALAAEFARTGPDDAKQFGAHLKVLVEKYRMVERQLPVFATEKQRSTRYVISDNFLSAWLAALLRNVRLARIRPLEEAVEKADTALLTHEGMAFEKFVRQTMEECSRKGVGDFSLTDLVRGYWNKADGSDIEIDVVALDETSKTIRFGCCKRDGDKHDRAVFEGHIARFLTTKEGKRHSDWTTQKALYSPVFSDDQRTRYGADGYICVDMNDFDLWLQ